MYQPSSEVTAYPARLTMQLMTRYVFYLPLSVDRKLVAAAKKTAEGLGATVLRTAMGQMLLEAEASEAAAVAKALPGWQYCVETTTHRIPERTPLQRARDRASKQSR